MFKKMALRGVERFERRFAYDSSYLKEILQISPRAFWAITRLQTLSGFRQHVPQEAWFAAKLVAALHEDCGPCAQLVVNMARHAGVSADVLRAVVTGAEETLGDELGDDVRLATRYARATLARSNDDSVISEVEQRWGKLGLLSLALAVVMSRFYPMLKYALGHGKACVRLCIDEAHLPVTRQKTAGQERGILS